MKIFIKSASAVGEVVRASRKAQKIRQDDAAGSIGVSENFLGKVESGSESVNWGKLFSVLDGLGIKVELDVPSNVANLLIKKNMKGLPKLIPQKIHSGEKEGSRTIKLEGSHEKKSKGAPKDTSNE